MIEKYDSPTLNQKSLEVGVNPTLCRNCKTSNFLVKPDTAILVQVPSRKSDSDILLNIALFSLTGKEGF